MVLIISNSGDLAEPVVDTLKHDGHEVVVFKSDRCLENEGISFTYTNGTNQVFIDSGTERLDLSNVRAAWFYKPMLPKLLREYEPHEDSIFIYRQFLTMWRSLTINLPHVTWLNDYFSSLKAEHKPYQLRVALDTGFKIPDTLVTSNPERAKEFWNHCNEQMIIKALAVSPFPKKVVFTNRVTEQHVVGFPRITSSPVILQKLIDKKREFRITVVGEEVFVASVSSEALIDWRRGLVKAEPANINDNLKNLCVRFVKALGLQFGCIDMIQGPDDEFYFLEINPNGQWRFIEEQAGLQIGKAISCILKQK